MYIHVVDSKYKTVQTYINDKIDLSGAYFKDIEWCLEEKRWSDWFCSYNQISTYLFWKHLTISV